MYNVTGSNLSIGIALVMRDQFTAQAIAARNAMQGLSNTAIAAEREQLNMQRNANLIGTAIGGAATFGIAKMYRESTKFGYLMEYVNILSDETGKSYGTLSEKALKLGEDTIFSAQQVSEGMRVMAQAGMSAKEINASIAGSTHLAASTMSDIQTSTEIMINASKAFKLPLDEKATTRMADIVATATNKATMDIHDYAEALKYAQSTAYNLETTFEELTAGIMVLSNAGMKGAIAGTGMDNLMRYATLAANAAPDSKDGKWLAKMGLTGADLKDSKNNLLPFHQILIKIGNGLKGLGTAETQEALYHIFGVRGMRPATILKNAGEDYYKFLEALNNSNGIAEKQAGKLLETPEGRIEELISTWQSFKVQFGSALQPIITPIIRVLSLSMEVINSITSTKTGRFIAVLLTGMVVFRTVLFAIRTARLSLQLMSMDFGRTLLHSTGLATAGINRVTGAANTATAALGRMGRAGGLGMLGFGVNNRTGGSKVGMFGYGYGQTANGRTYRMNGPGLGYTFLPNASRAARTYTGVSRFGGMMGAAAPWAMLGGMGLSMAGQAMGPDSSTGRGLDMAGTALSMGGTGAMFGSMFGPIGTAVGAVVGGVGGLLWSIYSDVDKIADEVNEASKYDKSIFDRDRWKSQFNNVKNRKQGERFYINDQQGKYSINGEPYKDQTPQSNIVINIDGSMVFKKSVREKNYEDTVNLGVY